MDASMKRYKKNLFVFPLCMLILSACGSDVMGDPEDFPENGNSVREITLTFNADVPVSATRAQGDNNIISTGSYIDVLVYAIYDESGNLLDYFGEGIENGVPATFGENKIGDGQTAIPFKIGDSKTVRLSVNPQKNYQIACWAQYSKCNAYTVSDLTAVKVSYDGVSNNDETRDAFCKTLMFSGSADNVNVTLRRPFAQINVGTSGADYRMLIQGKYVYPNMTVTKSQISVARVANTLDVLNHKAEALGPGPHEVTFSWENLPAFIRMDNIPAEDKLWDGSDNEEEFLKVKLNSEENGFLPYKVNYPTVDKTGKYKTETFKYLSMTYVLVPFTASADKETTTGSTVDVTIELKDATGAIEKSLDAKNITSVPVNANYRTNILGGLQYMKDRQPVYPSEDPDNPYTPTPPTNPEDPGTPYDPDDPENPGDGPDPEIPTDRDDPTSIFNTLNFKVILEPYFLWNQFDENGFSANLTESGQE